MSNSLRLTAIVWQEGEEFVSLCPEVDVASFGGNQSGPLLICGVSVLASAL